MASSATEHSLLRARSGHSSRSHSHRRLRHQHPSHGDRDHNREYHEDPPAQDAGTHGTDTQPQRREPQAPQQLNADNLVTQVIQTVSLIQYVDPAGSAYETETFLGPPSTVVIDAVSGNTVSIPPPNDALTAADIVPSAPPVPPVAPAPTDLVTSVPIEPAPLPPSTSLSLLPEPSVPPVPEPPVSSQSVPVPGSESVSQSLVVTSAPSSSASSHPSLTGSTGSRNSTSSASSNTLSSHPIHLGNSTLSAQALSTPTDTFVTPSADPTSSSNRQKSKSRITSSTDEILTTITSDFPSSTVTSFTEDFGGISGGAGGTGGLPGLPEPTSADSDDSDAPSSGGLSPENKQVIGGVVGGVAGIAVFAMLVFLLLRYKRRRDGQPLFGSAPTGSRGMITEGGDQGPSGPSMTQRSGAFGVSAALASLNRKAPPQQPGTEERGFYRISGKKLPSVLHAGGDGYTDPRESVMSGNSDYYRGSQEFDPSAAGGGRLALGTPMRPVSGVPVIRTGPARTPVAVTEENPFADPLPPSDPVGRSLIGQDGSRGSGSRFHERI